MKRKVIELEIIDELEESGVSAISLVDAPAINIEWMAFKEEKFVKPQGGESEDEFVSRCIGVLVGDEGYEQDQAAAICYSTWREEKFIDPNPCWEGYEAYGLKEDGTPNCIPVKNSKDKFSYDVSSLPPYVEEEPKKRKFQESYSDYPDAAVNAAKRALKYRDENPDVDCGTPIGWTRANQLAGRENISEETIARMASFARHLQYEDVPYTEGCGGLMVDAWGGRAGIEWAQRKLEDIREEMSYDFAETRPLARIPKEERGRTGSDKNEPGDTKSSRGGIEVSAEVEQTLRDKIKEHNDKNPQDSQKADMGMLKAVWRRGAGAYSVGTPGRKGMTRSQWAMGRVNAFLRILGGSAPSDKDYTQDNDLLPKSHPKHSEEKMSSYEQFGQNPTSDTKDETTTGIEQIVGVLGQGEYTSYFSTDPTSTKRRYFISEDQQIVVGPAMIPNMEIVRQDEDSKEIYYVKFSQETIAKIAEKFMRELRNKNTNVLHQEDLPADTYIMETWLVETEDDKAKTKYGFEVPIGTWMVKMRVTNDRVWKLIKNGKLKGLSIEGNFVDKSDIEDYERSKVLKQIIEILSEE
jgi:hypothetical protein